MRIGLELRVANTVMLGGSVRNYCLQLSSDCLGSLVWGRLVEEELGLTVRGSGPVSLPD
jgi:hypothetical protein